MSEVFVHKYGGILSAYGMALADVVHEEQAPFAGEYTQENFTSLDEKMDELSSACVAKLREQGFGDKNIVTEAYLHLRYDGTDCALMCLGGEGGDNATKHGDFLKTFIERYQTEFGFTLKDRKILVDDVRVRGVGKTEFAGEEAIAEAGSGEDVPEPVERTRVYFDGGFQDTGVFLLEKLKANHRLPGPAIIMDKLSTILVEPGCEATVSRQGNLRIAVGDSAGERKVGPELDTIQLSIFSHRFMSIAEQMGRILQRTSISTNIKERLDFSCALFGPDGGLVSNAPHIPVHLGAMQDTVRHQMKVLGKNCNILGCERL